MPSTVIQSFHYDAARALLTIRFVSGSVYVYLDVPPEVVDGLKTAPSKGIFYNQQIKGTFEYTRVQD